MSKVFIGCCGAYCKTCKMYQSNACKGCKLGYADGSRDLEKTNCAIKSCCMEKGCITCSDCEQYNICKKINAFYEKEGYRYRECQHATQVIRDEGYRTFLESAESGLKHLENFAQKEEHALEKVNIKPDNVINIQNIKRCC